MGRLIEHNKWDVPDLKIKMFSSTPNNLDPNKPELEKTKDGKTKFKKDKSGIKITITTATYVVPIIFVIFWIYASLLIFEFVNFIKNLII